MSIYNNFCGGAAAERVWSSRQYVDLVNEHFVQPGGVEQLQQMQKTDPFITAHLGTHDAYILTTDLNGSWQEECLDLTSPGRAAASIASLNARLSGGPSTGAPAAAASLQAQSQDPIIGATPAASPSAQATVPFNQRILAVFASACPAADLSRAQADLAQLWGRVFNNVPVTTANKGALPAACNATFTWLSPRLEQLKATLAAKPTDAATVAMARAELNDLRLVACCEFVVGQEYMKATPGSLGAEVRHAADTLTELTRLEALLPA